MTPIVANNVSNMMFALLFVLGLIFVAAYFARYLKNIPSLQQKQLKVLGSLSVGPKQKLVLLNIENRKILIGITPHNINSLGEFPGCDFKHQLEVVKLQESSSA